MPKREPKQPQPVKAWACRTNLRHVEPYGLQTPSQNVRVHIAPTATHAVVELAKVKEAFNAAHLATIFGRSDAFDSLKMLGFIPAKKPRKPKRRSKP